MKVLKEIQAEYDRLFEFTPPRDEKRGYRWLAKQLFKERNVGGGLLDVACGGGFFLREVAWLSNGEVPLTGVDLSRKALELAQRECPQAHFLLAQAEALPFQSESFDVVTCLGSLEHFLDLPGALQEMKRAVRKNGLFFILVPNLFWYKDLLSVLFRGERIPRNQTHETFASLGEWKGLLERLGLKPFKTVKYNGIAKNPLKQWLKNLLIPLRFSYHFLFICTQA